MVKYSKKDVLAGIVTFNPDVLRLKDNITALLRQTPNVYIIDNGSCNLDKIEELLSGIEGNVVFEKFEKNYGIAKALKQIMDYAHENNYHWVLTLDQDSVIEKGLIDTYVRYSNNPKCADAGMLTCLIKDRNFEDKKYENQHKDIIEVPYCITSAAFTNVERYFETNGYDVDFFIDAVDFDICYSLREAGYKVYRVKYLGLIHEVGHGENRHFLWKKIVIYHQKPFRIYYYAKNLITMHKKHKRLYPVPVMLKTEVALLIRILLYEDGKIEKMKAFFCGIRNKKYL